MSIADSLNAHPGYGPQLIAALRKRLAHKKHSVGLLAIILLETLAKNSAARLLPLIANDTFMSELVHVLPKLIRDPHNKGLFGSLKDYTRDIQAVERYDKILLFVDQMAKSFGRQYPVFGDTFRNLQRAGTIFPQLERDELAPVHTPPPSASVLAAKEAERVRQREQLESAERARREQDQERKRRELQHQAAKFRDPDARAAVETSCLFVDTLNETTPGEDLSKNELVQQIWSALKPIARRLNQRLSQLIASPNVPEDVLAEVLSANDACQEAGLFFEGLEKGTSQRRQPSAPAAVAAAAAASVSSSSSNPSSPADSPRQRPSRKSSSSTSSTPTTSEKKHVPLIQGPPGSASASAGGSHRKRSNAEPPAAAARIPEPTIDLLSFVAAPAAASASAGASSYPAPSDSFSHPRAPPPALSSPGGASRPEGALSPPTHAYFDEQDATIKQHNQAHVQKDPENAWRIAPPPQATANIDFFAPQVAAIKSQVDASTAATEARQPRQHQQQQQQFARPPAVSASASSATPFDSPEPADPFLALAQRSSPNAQQPPVQSQGWNQLQARPSSHQRAAAAAPANGHNKSIVDEFDLLRFS